MNETSTTAAKKLIDEALQDFSARALVDSDQVCNLLLDLRLLVMAPAEIILLTA